MTGSTEPRLLRLGIDVGGTNTDAVVVDRDGLVLAKAKVPTTPDVTSGMVAAISRVGAHRSVRPQLVSHVMIGTTHATNAVLERRHLRRVAVVRIGSPSADAIPPLYGWPADLRAALGGHSVVVGGGAEVDGRPIAPLDTKGLSRFLDSLPAEVDGHPAGLAVSSVFAPVSPDHELQARELVRDRLGSDVHVSLSHEIGSLGLLQRENATVLNEALVGVVERVASSITVALADSGLADPLVFFVQNDGTLMMRDYALDYPVLTIGSGPANSMRGAAHLAGVKDAVVVDVGGTSTDVGVLVSGFPRESTSGVRIGGVTTNFRMPDLVSIAVGGGSVLRRSAEGVQVGPDSVTYRIGERALVFGGPDATLSDAAVAAGRAALGDRMPAAAHGDLLAAGLAAADSAVAAAVDRVKTSRGDVPLIAVGGGSVLLPDSLPGASEVVRPEHYEVANAIGATIGDVSGHVDKVFSLVGTDRTAVLEEAAQTARGRAVRAGADPTRIAVVEIDEIPLSYLDQPAVRVRVKAAGPLGSL